MKIKFSKISLSILVFFIIGLNAFATITTVKFGAVASNTTQSYSADNMVNGQARRLLIYSGGADTRTLTAASDGFTATGGSKLSSTSYYGKALETNTKTYVKFTGFAGDSVTLYYYYSSAISGKSMYVSDSINTTAALSTITFSAAVAATVYSVTYVVPTDGHTYYFSSNASVYVAGIKFASHARAPKLSTLSIAGTAGTFANDSTIKVNLPYTSYAKGQSVSSSLISATTDSSSVTTQILKGVTDISSSTFNVGDTITYIVTKNSLSRTYKVITSADVPAPVISTASVTSQSLKGGHSISNIVYALKNATGATVTGLSGGLTYNLNATSDTITISGSPSFATYPDTIKYTVTATAIFGYTGSAVTATGTIIVKDPSKKSVAFLYTSTTAPTGANKLYYVLNQNYNVDVLAPTTAAAVDALVAGGTYDLIVLHEAVNSSSAAAVELGKFIGQVPILNTKAHMYSKTNWPAGSAANGANNDTTVNVNTSYLSHPIFNGVTFKNDSVVSMESDSTGIVRYVTGVTYGNGVLAIANNKGSKGVSIIEKNNQTTSDSKKYMLIALSAASENLNSNGLLLLKNACDYLMSSTVYVPAILTNLTVSAGTMSPAFTSATKSYKVALSAGTADYPTITPTAITGATVDSISKTAFNGGGVAIIHVTSGDGLTKATYTITFTDSIATGIKTATSAFKVYGSGSAVIIEGAAGANVSLVTVSGIKLFTGKTISTKETLPVSLEKGVYIVIVDGVATKVLVK